MSGLRVTPSWFIYWPWTTKKSPTLFVQFPLAPGFWEAAWLLNIRKEEASVTYNLVISWALPFPQPVGKDPKMENVCHLSRQVGKTPNKWENLDSSFLRVSQEISSVMAVFYCQSLCWGHRGDEPHPWASGRLLLLQSSINAYSWALDP